MRIKNKIAERVSSIDPIAVAMKMRNPDKIIYLVITKTSAINKIGNFGLKLISFFVTGRWFTDTESGFRAYKAAKLYELDLEAEGYEIESDLFLKSLHKCHSVKEVPITVPKAVPGVTVVDGFKMGIFKIKLGIKLKLFKEDK